MNAIQFFFVGCSTSYEPSLSSFFDTYCRKHAGPAAGHGASSVCCGVACALGETGQRREPPEVADAPCCAVPPDAPSIFISYMREDADAARRLYDAITSLGGDVWLDERAATVRAMPGNGRF